MLAPGYAALPAAFYARVAPTPLTEPYLVATNAAAASDFDLGGLGDERQLLDAASGTVLPGGCTPIAAVYAGHQFGAWVQQLGDGRAIAIADVRDARGALWELQLKGAGETPFSRSGDGRAVLRSTIREFLCSEAMHALGIPTTRALCIVGSDTPVYRESVETAAVLARIAPSHVRFGTFEYFYYRGDREAVALLANYAIARHYPELAGRSDRYEALFRQIVLSTARLIAFWQAVGFEHGVMNTDNMSVAGITLDYGPFGFMEAYDPDWICNHSDHLGRYRFSAQPGVALWNLHCLAAAMGTLLSEEAALLALAEYEPALRTAYLERSLRKLGLHSWPGEAGSLLADLLAIMRRSGADYTIAFRALAKVGRVPSDADQAFLANIATADAGPWLLRYREALESQHISDAERSRSMRSVNPKYVLRNYLAHQAIERAARREFDEVARLLEILQRPYDAWPQYESYAAPPPPWANDLQLSCSS